MDAATPHAERATNEPLHGPLDPPDPLEQLWGRLGRPFVVVPTVAAIIGLSPAVAAQLVGLRTATSTEAETLLASMPAAMRSLATSIHTNAERCLGELRGPVLWSETMSARASSFGDEGLFVCSAPSRAYDTDENRVLVKALAEILEASRLLTDTNDHHFDDPMVVAARRNGATANRYIEHPSLRSVSRKRPKARAIKRTRSGKHKKTYLPALQMLERATNPVTLDDVRGWSDRRTLAQHHVLMAIVERLERTGGRLPDFRVERGALYAGPVQYLHARHLGDRSTPSGIVIGQLLVDVPDRLSETSRRRAEHQLAARSGGLPTMVVMDDEDLDRVVDRAIELTRGAA